MSKPRNSAMETRVRNALTSRLNQLFQDNQGKGRFEVKASAAEATIYLYDLIGEWYGVGPLDFAKEMQAITAPVIHLRINSPGGDVFDARAMQTTLKQHAAKVIAHIDGVAASAATFLALGADEIEMSAGAQFMIHNSWGFNIGNKNDMLAMAKFLDKIDQGISQDYQKKTGQNAAQIQALMDAETWMDGQEALDAGFVDRVYTGETVENRWNLGAYDHAPESFRAAAAPEPQFDRATIERRLALIENTGR